MIKTILKLLILVVVVILIIAAVYVYTQYKPFIDEEFAFHVKYKDEKTHVVNDNFNFSFDINKKCKLDSEPLNYLSFKGRWLGKFICDGGRNISLYIWDYDKDTIDRSRKLDGYQEKGNIIIIYPNKERKFNSLMASDKEKTKMLNLGILYEEEGVFESIVESLDEI